MIFNLTKSSQFDISIFSEWADMDFMKEPIALLEHTVGTHDGLKFSINAKDHPPAHIHVMRNDQTLARIDLRDNTVMTKSNDFSKSDQKRATNWLQKHNQNGDLTAIFNQYNESINIYFYFHNGKLCLSQDLFKVFMETFI